MRVQKYLVWEKESSRRSPKARESGVNHNQLKLLQLVHVGPRCTSVSCRIALAACLRLPKDVHQVKEPGIERHVTCSNELH
jgi:hypothetical protein